MANDDDRFGKIPPAPLAGLSAGGTNISWPLCAHDFERLQPTYPVRQQTAIFLFPVEVVAWLITALRQLSATATPSSPCFRMNAFCASEHFDAFIVFRSSSRRIMHGKL
jgi:hypothetical protein